MHFSACPFLRPIQRRLECLAEVAGIDFLSAVFIPEAGGKHLRRNSHQTPFGAGIPVKIGAMNEQMDVRVIGVAMDAGNPSEFVGPKFISDPRDGFACDIAKRFLANRFITAESLKVFVAKADGDVDEFVLLGPESLFAERTHWEAKDGVEMERCLLKWR
jgi:hypothetical protein